MAAVEPAADRLGSLRKGIAPFSEPGIDDALERALAGGRLSFVDDLPASPVSCDAILIAVPAPTSARGEVDLAVLDSVLSKVARREDLRSAIVVVRSTLGPGDSDQLVALHPSLRERLVYWPAFLRQGRALADSSSPDRIVLGVFDKGRSAQLRNLLGPLVPPHRLVVLSLREAELVKQFSNAILAVNRVLAADISLICGQYGVDFRAVFEGITLDHRMGRELLEVKPGLGDSCLTKDIDALCAALPEPRSAAALLDIARQRSRVQRREAVAAVLGELQRASGRSPSLALVGLSYEPGVGDVRDALSVELAGAARDIARVRVWDPYVSLRDLAEHFPTAERASSLEDAFRASSVAVILVDHPELDGSLWRLIESMDEDACVFDFAGLEPRSFAAVSRKIRRWADAR